MTRLAHQPVLVTGGVDTHKHTHVASAIDDIGRELGTAEFAATMGGYRELLGWLRGFGDVVAVGVEGTGAWGAGLSRHLRGEGLRVIEVQRPNRQDRRRYGKSDPTDALSAARAVLAGKETGEPKAADGVIEAIRLLRVARRSAVKARTQAANQIHSIVDTAPEAVRAAVSVEADHEHRIARAARFHLTNANTPAGAAKLALRALARRWQALDEEIGLLDSQLEQLVARAAPGLLELNGVGPQCAAAFLVAAGDNPERLRSEASFAALCGSSPLDASSGQQRRHRLNRGGDRDANAALYIVAISRLRWEPRTKTYMARRLAEGKTRKEVIRCLKRYIAREIYRAIRAEVVLRIPHTTAPPTTATHAA